MKRDLRLGGIVSDGEGWLEGVARNLGLEAADLPGGAVRQVFEAVMEAILAPLPELPAGGVRR